MPADNILRFPSAVKYDLAIDTWLGGALARLVDAAYADIRARLRD
jgi:hypothetical protein